MRVDGEALLESSNLPGVALIPSPQGQAQSAGKVVT